MSELSGLSQLPGLEELSSRLSEVLDPELLIPKEKADKLKATNQKRDFYRKQLISARVLHHGLDTLLLQLDTGDTESLSASQCKALNLLYSHWSAAQLEDSLNLGAGQLLGLQIEDLTRHLKELTQSDKREIESLLEEHLIGICEQLLQQLDPAATTKEEQHSFMSKYGRLCTLPDMLQNEIEGIEQKFVFSEADFLREWQALNSMSKSFGLLESVAQNYKLKTHAEKAKVNVHFHAVQSKTLLLKMKCLELEILTQTYDETSIKALTRIRKYLKESISNVKTAIDQTKTSLLQYEAVGDDFGAIVKQYAKLKEDIAGKKWAIQELKDHQNANDDI